MSDKQMCPKCAEIAARMAEQEIREGSPEHAASAIRARASSGRAEWWVFPYKIVGHFNQPDRTSDSHRLLGVRVEWPEKELLINGVSAIEKAMLAAHAAQINDGTAQVSSVSDQSPARASEAEPASAPSPNYDLLGYALAMRVMQSDLYRQLDDVEHAQCDELIARGMGRPSAAPAPAGMPEMFAKLRSLLDKATPGPWAWDQRGEKTNEWGIGVALTRDDQPISGRFVDNDTSYCEYVCSHEAATCNYHDPELITYLRNNAESIIAFAAAETKRAEAVSADARDLRREMDREHAARVAAERALENVLETFLYPPPEPAMILSWKKHEDAYYDGCAAVRNGLKAALAAAKQKEPRT